ncbi:MAG TPA: M56 family metallopeptidase [Mycobacteriales bacterium]|nr:M56 family metallopeptidase [Mycobacteriales bacterium]
MTTTVATLAVLAAVLVGPVARRLATAAWVRREPRAALVLWQSLGLSAGLAAVGAFVAVGVAPLGAAFPGAVAEWTRRGAAGDPTGGLDAVHLLPLAVGLVLLGRLLGVLALAGWRTARSRARHREVVDLVGRPWERDGGATVLDHPGVAAYCLPGPRSRVVLTAGAVALLDDDELDAVLAHERAHVAERHDLVVLPFSAWATALPWIPGVRAARRSVTRLVEMVADDRACVGRDRAVLATALARVGTAGAHAPAGALGVVDDAVVDRVRRLLDPPTSSPRARRLALSAAAGLLLLPVLVLL